MREFNDSVTTQELADILGVSVVTIYNMIKRKEITPENLEKRQIEGTYLFSRSEVERVQQKYKKPDLTTNDVAKLINKSVASVLRYIKEGDLPSYQRFYKGKLRHFIKKEDVDAFSLKLKEQQVKRGSNAFYSKISKYFLFQPFKHKQTGEYARIMEFNNHFEGKLVTEQGETIDLYEIRDTGFEPIIYLQKKKTVTKRGYVEFLFPISTQIKSPIFLLIERMYQDAGYTNLKLEKKADRIYVSIKPILLGLDKMDIDKIDLLKNYLVKGDVLTRVNGVYLDSNLESVSTFIGTDKKELIKVIADEQQLTIEQFVENAIDLSLEITQYCMDRGITLDEFKQSYSSIKE